MAEVVTLTTPVTHPTQTGMVLDRIIIDVTGRSVLIQWLGNNGEAASAFYPTPAVLNPLGVLQPTGAVLINTLNNANLSLISMVKRIFQRLQTDGYIAAGTITGTPD